MSLSWSLVFLASAATDRLFPNRALAKKTYPKPGRDFRTFCTRPESRSLDDKVEFAVWLRELLQVKKSVRGVWSVWEELRRAGFPRDLRHEFIETDPPLTQNQMVRMVEVIVFPDESERDQIRATANNIMCERNKERQSGF